MRCYHCLWKKGINQLHQSKPAKKTCNPMTSFQKAHHKPEKQFCINFVSNNIIKKILLVEKRLSVLMFHELYINSAQKTCLVGKTCHLFCSSESIMAGTKRVFISPDLKGFCASFWNHVDLLPKQRASRSECLHKWSNLLMFPRTEQRIVTFKKHFQIIQKVLFTYLPSGSKCHFWNFPKEQLKIILKILSKSIKQSRLCTSWNFCPGK